MKVGDLVRCWTHGRVGILVEGPWAAEDVEGETLLKVAVAFINEPGIAEMDTDLLEVVK